MFIIVVVLFVAVVSIAIGIVFFGQHICHCCSDFFLETAMNGYNFMELMLQLEEI